MSEILDQAVEAAAADDLQGQHLTFDIGEAIYSVELQYVVEIIQVQNITQVPYIPAYIKGIINLRGSIVPVIDVRLKMGLPVRPYDEKTCIIIIRINDMQIGMIVDSVEGVASLEPDDLSDPPKLDASHRNEYLKSIAEKGEHIILNLDCEKFFFGDVA